MTHYLKEAFQEHGIQSKSLATYLVLTQARVSQMLNNTPGPTLQVEVQMVKFLFDALDLKHDTEVCTNNGLQS